MDNQLGIGAYKFQNLVNKGIRSSRDVITQRSQINIEHRLSIIEKSKINSKSNSKGRVNIQQPKSPTASFLLGNKQVQQQFVLVVSSSESESDSDSQQSECDQNAMKIVSKLNQHPIISITPQPSPNRYEQKQAYPINNTRKEINFLRGLCQNTTLFNNNTVKLDEYKYNREIIVDIECKEIGTFLRLQHEVEEMRRKQMDFTEQKVRHFEALYQNKNRPRQSKEDFWTVMAAKRTAKRLIKNMNLKRKKSLENKIKMSKSIHITN